MSVTATLSVKAGLGRRHIASAEHFALQCQQIAIDEGSLEWPQPRWDESQSLATAAVVLSVASIEATINEFFLEAVDGRSEAMRRIGDNKSRILATLWDEVDNYSILKKYEVALTVCEAASYDKGQDLYQSASALVEMRNALVHFKPEWDHSLDRHAKLKQRVAGRFEDCKLSAMARGKMIWFPHACLGAGCAAWATVTVRSFLTDFCNRLGIPNRC